MLQGWTGWDWQLPSHDLPHDVQPCDLQPDVQRQYSRQCTLGLLFCADVLRSKKSSIFNG